MNREFIEGYKYIVDEKRQNIKQKLLGIALIIASVASVLIEGDATAAVLFVPMGLYLLLVKDALEED